MEKSPHIALLELLEKGGIAVEVNISPFMCANFINPANDSDDINHQNDRAMLFLHTMFDKKRIFFEKTSTFSRMHELKEGSYEKYWFYDLYVGASITIDGLDYLQEHRLVSSNLSVNQSMVENNRIISESSTVQATMIKKQTRLFYFTAIVAFVSFILSVINYYTSHSKEQLQKQLSTQTQQIHKLQIQLSQLMTGSSQVSKEKVVSKTK